MKAARGADCCSRTFPGLITPNSRWRSLRARLASDEVNRFDFGGLKLKDIGRILSILSKNVRQDDKIYRLDVQVANIERVVLDELTTRLDRIAHQHGENLVRFHRIIDSDFQERSLVGIHRRLPKLLRVHLAQTFITLD